MDHGRSESSTGPFQEGVVDLDVLGLPRSGENFAFPRHFPRQKHRPDARTPLQQGVVDSGHFGPPANPVHEGYVDYGF